MDKDTTKSADTSPAHATLDGTDSGSKLVLAQIDHEEYDALADLFLGDGAMGPATAEPETQRGQQEPDEPADTEPNSEAPESEATQSEPTSEPPAHETHTPVLQLTRHEDDAELGSMDQSYHEQFEMQTPSLHVLDSLDATDSHASVLLEELMRQATTEAETDGAIDEAAFESLAEIASQFEDDASAAIDYIAMPNPTIEIVVLGHLPVRATLWARQYACNQSKALDQTVALIRAASGSTSVDLIGDGRTHRAGSYKSIEEALAVVNDLADRVILRVDEACEPDLIDRPQVEEITILSGADEAAVVASYRLVKTLDATLNEQYMQYMEGEGPTLRLAVMGAGREVAMDACTKLENAVETFIQRPIEIVIGAGQIDATGTTSLYRASTTHRGADIINALVAAAGGQDLRVHEPIDHAPAESLQVEFPAKGVPMPEGSAAHKAKPEAKPAVEEPVFSKSVSSNPVSNKPVADQSDAPTLRDGLCAMIPGLSPIETRCPKAPGVELAIDELGRLHMIVNDADTDDAMNRLLSAQSWARNNLALLIRAEPGLRMPTADRDVDTDALMHLIAVDPRAVRDIYDTPVRVYSLARVKVGKIIAQIATPVN